MSRFQIHDELTAPPGSLPVLKGATSTAGQLPNFLGVMAGSPAALRGYVRFRSELRHGVLPPATVERIALAVAQHDSSKPGLALHERLARHAGLGMDEITKAKRWSSEDPRQAKLLALTKALTVNRGVPPTHLVEEAREAGWNDEEILEAIAILALETFSAMVNVAGDVPVDGSTEETRTLEAVA